MISDPAAVKKIAGVIIAERAEEFVSVIGIEKSKEGPHRKSSHLDDRSIGRAFRLTLLAFLATRTIG